MEGAVACILCYSLMLLLVKLFSISLAQLLRKDKGAGPSYCFLIEA